MTHKWTWPPPKLTRNATGKVVRKMIRKVTRKMTHKVNGKVTYQVTHKIISKVTCRKKIFLKQEFWNKLRNRFPEGVQEMKSRIKEFRNQNYKMKNAPLLS